MGDKLSLRRWILRTIKFIFCLSMMAGFQADTNAQTTGLFETASVEHLIKRQFKLSSGDMRTLSPLVRRENEVLLSILDRCSDSENKNYMSLWNSIRRTNSDFEANAIRGLTLVQKKAIHKARFELEMRILDYWLDDYLQELDELLEFDWVQTNRVALVFENEFEERIKLLVGGSGGSTSTDELWFKLSEERDARLEKILTPDQLQEYRLSNHQVNRLEGKHTNVNFVIYRGS